MKKPQSNTSNVSLFRWSDVEKETLTPLLDRQMISGQRIMLSHLSLRKGCVVALHRHDNEQFSYVLEGALRFWYGHNELQVIDIHPGEVLYLPSNVPHKAAALEDSLSLDIFSPPRQDWLDGTDGYIKKQG